MSTPESAGPSRRKAFSQKNNLQRMPRTSLEINNEYAAPKPTPKTSVDSLPKQQINTQTQEGNSEYMNINRVLFLTDFQENLQNHDSDRASKQLRKRLRMKKRSRNSVTQRRRRILWCKRWRRSERLIEWVWSMISKVRLKKFYILDREKEKRKRGLWDGFQVLSN